MNRMNPSTHLMSGVDGPSDVAGWGGGGLKSKWHYRWKELERWKQDDGWILARFSGLFHSSEFRVCQMWLSGIEMGPVKILIYHSKENETEVNGNPCRAKQGTFDNYF